MQCTVHGITTKDNIHNLVPGELHDSFNDLVSKTEVSLKVDILKGDVQRYQHKNKNEICISNFQDIFNKGKNKKS